MMWRAMATLALSAGNAGGATLEKIGREFPSCSSLHSCISLLQASGELSLLLICEITTSFTSIRDSVDACIVRCVLWIA